MWETIGEILTSSNAVGVLLILGFLLIVCIIVAVVLIKCNVFQIHTQAVSVGYQDKERNIIRQQLNHVWLHLQDVEANIPKDEDYDEHLGQEIILKMYKVYTDWISFNHISRSKSYIPLKQKEMVAVVNALTKNEKYKTEEFKEWLNEDIKETIYALIDIRETFK